MSQGNDPLPVMPLNYQKPAAMPWRPVRLAMGVYLLLNGLAALGTVLPALPRLGNGPSGFGRSFPTSYLYLNLYLVAGICYVWAAVGFFRSLKSRHWVALMAIVIGSARNLVQLYDIVFYQLGRVPSGTRTQWLLTYAATYFVPLALIYFIMAFNQYDKSQDELKPWI